VDPVPDPLLLRKCGGAGNRTQDLWRNFNIFYNILTLTFNILKDSDTIHASKFNEVFKWFIG
jgi:hypothetical protein